MKDKCKVSSFLFFLRSHGRSGTAIGKVLFKNATFRIPQPALTGPNIYPASLTVSNSPQPDISLNLKHRPAALPSRKQRTSSVVAFQLWNGLIGEACLVTMDWIKMNRNCSLFNLWNFCLRCGNNLAVFKYCISWPGVRLLHFGLQNVLSWPIALSIAFWSHLSHSSGLEF